MEEEGGKKEREREREKGKGKERGKGERKSKLITRSLTLTSAPWFNNNSQMDKFSALTA